MKAGKAFTLVELLAVIIVLGILFAIAIPATSKIIDWYKRRAFFISTFNIVESISSEMLFADDNYACKLESTDDGDPNNIIPDNLYTNFMIKAYNVDGVTKFYVHAESVLSDYKIDTYDFESLSISDPESWSMTYTDDITQLADAITLLLSYGNNLPICK